MTDGFDLKNKVYAVSSNRHFMISHFALYQFEEGNQYQCLRCVDTLTQLVMNYINDTTERENFFCQAVEVKEDMAYLLLTGEITREEDHSRRNEGRLLKITGEGELQETCFEGMNIGSVGNILVVGDELYIACDKMIIIKNMLSGKETYLTCLSCEDEEELLLHRRQRV